MGRVLDGVRLGLLFPPILEARDWRQVEIKQGVNTKPFLFAPLLFLIMDTHVKLITISHANISNSKVII